MVRNKTDNPKIDNQRAARDTPLTLADTQRSDVLRGGGGNDVLSARNGNDELRGNAGDDLLISYSDSGEPPVLGEQVVNQNEPRRVSNDSLRGGEGADTFMWALEIDAKPELLEKHTQADGRINGANDALAGENNNSHDHWVEGIGKDVIQDLTLEEGDKIVINGHTTENYKIDKKGQSYILNLRSNQGNADQNNPNGAHDGDLLGTIELRGAAAKYSEQQILDAITINSKVNYVADGRGVQVLEADTTANRDGVANGRTDRGGVPETDRGGVPETDRGAAPNRDNLRIQAEDMALYGAYKVESVDAASNNKVISLKGGPNDETGQASFKFEGADGKYKVKMGYFDENDGVGQLDLMQGENQLFSLDLDESLGSSFPVEETLTSRTISNIDARSGDIFTIQGIEDGSSATAERARVDYIEFIPMGGISEPASGDMMSPMETEISMAAPAVVEDVSPMAV